MTDSLERDVAVEAAAPPGTEDVRPIERVPLIAADRDNDAGRLDAAAGCEFVDDCIRVRE